MPNTSNLKQYPQLLADIGGTNARFAIVDKPGGALLEYRRFSTAGYPTLESAIVDYLDHSNDVHSAVLAIAGPVIADEVNLTNHHWSLNKAQLKQLLGISELLVINDFSAIAHATQHLQEHQLEQVGKGSGSPGAPIAILGPGTGLGVALRIDTTNGVTCLSTEGGHVSLAPVTELEMAIFRYWFSRNMPLKRETFLCGPGIYRIYEAICDIENSAVSAASEREVFDAASSGTDNICERTLGVFFDLLGSACADQVLAAGALGGVFLAGGILPQMITQIRNSNFRARFESKHPNAQYVRCVPTFIITEADCGILGAHYAFLDQQR